MSHASDTATPGPIICNLHPTLGAELTRRRGDRPVGEICFANMYRVYEALPNKRGQYHEGVYRSASSRALASTRSGVSNPSVNQL